MAKYRTKTWETADIALQSLYGISLYDSSKMRPYFGSAVKFPLTTGHFGTRHEQTEDRGLVVTNVGAGTEELLAPTILNLAWHFGYMRWAVDNLAAILRQSKGLIQARHIDERFFNGAMNIARGEFEHQRLLPLRKALNDQHIPLYLYCVPSVSIETEITTGKPLMAEGDRVLCVLPKTVKTARDYGLTEMEINVLAPQVVWLIKTLCSMHAIRTSDQLVANLDGWIEYLNPMILEQIREAIGQVNPHLLSTKVMALLPSAS